MTANCILQAVYHSAISTIGGKKCHHHVHSGNKANNKHGLDGAKKIEELFRTAATLRFCDTCTEPWICVFQCWK